VGCTKKDLQNYYTDFRNKIKDADAQMFIDNLGMLKKLEPSFFFEYEVNDGQLVRVFWAIQLVGRTMSILVMCYLLILLTTRTNMT
jgi:hypothetical protein